MLIKLLFKKPDVLPDDVQALIDVSVSLRQRVDKVVQFYDMGEARSTSRLAA